jgi:hypothetical protein
VRTAFTPSSPSSFRAATSTLPGPSTGWGGCASRDPRVRDNESYLTVLLLARVVTELGTLSDTQVNPGVIEGLFASDLAFLQDLYRRVNQEGHTRAAVTCPSCNHGFEVDVTGDGLGGS